MKKLLFIAAAITILAHGNLMAHCQLPCGIYHDEMVFEEIDQYVETTYKAISVMLENKFDTVVDKNQFIRWTMEKEESSNLVARRLMEYFLQQKIKPGNDPETTAKVAAVHRLLFGLVQIKQNVDLSLVKKFGEEWEQFKLLFHSKDYECTMDMKRFEEEKAKFEETQKKKGASSNQNQDIKTMVPKPINGKP